MSDERLLVSTIPLDEFEEPFPVARLIEVLSGRHFDSDRDDLIEALVWPADADHTENFLTYIVFPQADGIVFSWQLKPGPELYSLANPEQLGQLLYTAWDDPFPKGLVVPFEQAWEILRQFAGDPQSPPPATTWITKDRWVEAPATSGRISYSHGNEQGPNGIFGAYSLVFDLDDGAGVVERRWMGRHDRWQVRLSPGWRELVAQALEASPFPTSDFGARAADSVWRTLSVNQQDCTVEWRVGIDDPRWAPLFALLDGIFWLVCPERLGGNRPDALDASWVAVTD